MEQNQVKEIARAEYFSGANEPTITMKQNVIRFSSHCLNKYPTFDYVLFAMYPAEKRLVIEPCSPDLRDAIRWSTRNPNNRKPKAITCKEYYRRLCELMSWNNKYRYTVLGKICNDGSSEVIAFDLSSAIVYRPVINGNRLRTPEYPSSWSDGFGMSAEEHRNNPLVKRFHAETDILLSASQDIDVKDTSNSLEDIYGGEL